MFDKQSPVCYTLEVSVTPIVRVSSNVYRARNANYIYIIYKDTEAYRSGHNEAVLKCA